MNPLGMVDALLCAMNHAATLQLQDWKVRHRRTRVRPSFACRFLTNVLPAFDQEHDDAGDHDPAKKEEAEAILHFTGLLKKALHNTFRCRRSTPYSNMLPHSPHVLFLGVGTGKGHGTWPVRPA